MKTEDRFAKLKDLPFIQSRIPALDALGMFVAKGQEEAPEVRKFTGSKGSSRWFPVEGGHKVLIPHEGGEFDAKRFQVEKGAWDHEHCKFCNADIEPMTLCWVTKSGPYVILCIECHKEMTKK